MPTIIEFALIHLPQPTTTHTPALLAALGPVTSIIQAASTLPTRFFTDLTDPHTMYVIGGWPSMEAHRDGFEGSEAQAGLWPLLNGMMEIRWMEYFDVEEGMLPVEKDGEMGGAGVGRCLGVGVWRVPRTIGGEDGGREEARAVVEGAVKDVFGEVVWAWNIKKGKQEAEEDVLVGFVGMGRHQAGKWVEKVTATRGEMQPQAFVMERTVLSSGES